jgi:hypothetical protein
LISLQQNQLFTANMSVIEIYNRYKDSLMNQTELEKFYNNVLGLPYTSSGSKVTKEMLDSCIDSEHSLLEKSDDYTYMGIDPGKRIHYVILRRNELLKKLDLIDFGFIYNIEEIHTLVKRYKVRIGMIDASPELQLVNTLLNTYKYFGRVRYYIDKIKTQRIVSRQEKLVSVNRRYEMDRIRERFVMKNYRLPKDIEKTKDYEFYKHLQAPIRKYNESKDDYEWIEGSFRDDLFHALIYATLASEVII